MIDQDKTLSALDSHQEQQEAAMQQFLIDAQHLPEGGKLNDDQKLGMFRNYQKWLATLNAAIVTGLRDKENGFFVDENYAGTLSPHVVAFIHCADNMFEVYGDIKATYNDIVPVPVAKSFETIQRFIATFSPDAITDIQQKLTKWSIDTSYLRKKFKKPMTESKKKSISILIGAASILVALASFFFSKALPDEAKGWLSVLFAVGIGGILTGIVGFVTVKFPIGGPIVSAGGGIAVALLLMYHPPKFLDRADFAVEIILKKKNGSPLTENLPLGLTIDGVAYTKSFSGEKYRYEGVSARKKDNSVAKLTLPENSKWLFDSAAFVTSITVAPSVTELIVGRNPASLQLKGYIDPKGDRKVKLEGITISVVGYPQHNQTTSSDGTFTIQMPEDFPDEQVTLSWVVGKNKLMRLAFPLGNKSPLPLPVK